MAVTGNKRGGDSTVYKVKEWLEAAGFTVFMDNSLEGGDDWGSVINDNLINACCMVALCSTHFAQPRKPHEPMPGTSWTRNEVSSFLKLRPHDLIPLLHSGSWPPQSLHVECSRIEEIKLSHGFEQAMDELVAAVSKRCAVPACPAEGAAPEVRVAPSVTACLTLAVCRSQ